MKEKGWKEKIKMRQKLKKRQKKTLKKEQKKLKKLKKQMRKNNGVIEFGPQSPKPEVADDVPIGPSTAMLHEASRARAPMTKEEWERQQSTISRVLDPDSGRYRLVRGTGEVLEECVSRSRQAAINRTATIADGHAFQAGLKNKLD